MSFARDSSNSGKLSGRGETHEAAQTHADNAAVVRDDLANTGVMPPDDLAKGRAPTYELGTSSSTSAPAIHEASFMDHVVVADLYVELDHHGLHILRDNGGLGIGASKPRYCLHGFPAG